MYRPLPPYLTIKESHIEGLGLFTTEDIDPNHKIGVTHVRDNRFQDGYIRTPLGGFFNHSETPNCKVEFEGDYIVLSTLIKINAGDEITAKYIFYTPTKVK